VVAIVGANHKCTTLNAIKSKEAKEIPPCLKEHWEKFGKFEELGSDNGKEFTAALIARLREYEGITSVRGLPYCPEMQGRIERHNRTIKYRFFRDILRIETSEGRRAAARK